MLGSSILQFLLLEVKSFYPLYTISEAPLWILSILQCVVVGEKEKLNMHEVAEMIFAVQRGYM